MSHKFNPAESEPDPNLFAEQADAPSTGIFREFWDFLRHNKKWWLIPIILTLLLIGLLVVLSGSVVAPFIYPLF